MSATDIANPAGTSDFVEDWSADKQTYHVPWGKAMMWLFLSQRHVYFHLFLGGLFKRQANNH